MNNLKKTYSLTIAFLLTISQSASAQPIQVSPDETTTINLSGIIVGPIVTGSKKDGTFFKAYHLKLPKPINFDDSDACGEQKISSLPLNEFGMDKYKGKRVHIKAHIICQLRGTGSYHLQDLRIQPQ